METGYIDFRVDIGKWKTTQKTGVADDLTTLSEALLIAHATQGVDATVEDALRGVMNLGELDAVLNKARTEKNFAGALTVLSSRVFGKVLAALTDQPGWQAKEKKMMQELLRLHSTRLLARHFGMDLNYDNASTVLLGASAPVKEGTIQFIANYSAWKCVKKFRIEEKTNRRTVAEFMTSYAITLDLRFETYLRTLTDLNALENALKNAPKKGTTMAGPLDFLNTNEVANTIQKIAVKAAPGKTDDAVAVLKTFALRKILKENGLFADYAQIKSLPGWKRVIGKRK